MRLPPGESIRKAECPSQVSSFAMWRNLEQERRGRIGRRVRIGWAAKKDPTVTSTAAPTAMEAPSRAAVSHLRRESRLYSERMYIQRTTFR